MPTTEGSEQPELGLTAERRVEALSPAPYFPALPFTPHSPAKYTVTGLQNTLGNSQLARIPSPTWIFYTWAAHPGFTL